MGITLYVLRGMCLQRLHGVNGYEMKKQVIAVIYYYILHWVGVFGEGRYSTKQEIKQHKSNLMLQTLNYDK